jgi:putative redox protein
MTSLTSSRSDIQTPTETSPHEKIAAERSAALRTAGAGWQNRIAEDPANALIKASASGTGGAGVVTHIRTGGHRFDIDEPAGLGGHNTGANPVEHALAALIGCHVVVYRLYAEALGITIDEISGKADGDIDVRTLFGLEGGGRPGFSKIRASITITGPETPERYAELKEIVDARCPVLDLFQNPTPVQTTLVTV